MKNWTPRRNQVSVRRFKLVVNEMIDRIYLKERKYVRNFDKDNAVLACSPIFELSKVQNLKTATGIEKS